MNDCCCGGQRPLTLKIKQGESKGFAFTLSKNGQPFDLSNLQMLLQVRENMQDTGEYVIQKTISENSDAELYGQINNPTGGQFYFKINDTDIESMSTSKPYYFAIYKVSDEDKICISAPYFQTAVFLVLNP